jgi:hypothetical protein
MHATLAYLNAAGRRATRLTRSSCAFIQVMDALLAGAQGAWRRKAKSPRQIVRPTTPASSPEGGRSTTPGALHTAHRAARHAP